jgi:hypothetical protein
MDRRRQDTPLPLQPAPDDHDLTSLPGRPRLRGQPGNRVCPALKHPGTVHTLGKGATTMTVNPTAWPDTTHTGPSTDHPYQSATWLLGRHPRLARLAARITGVIQVDPDHAQPSIDVDHLGDVFAAWPTYTQAWDEYHPPRRAADATSRDQHHHRPPTDDDDNAYYRWREAGPNPDDYADGLSDLIVMSSGELAVLRLLATLGSTRVPLRLADLSSLDREGQRLLADWCHAIQTA